MDTVLTLFSSNTLTIFTLLHLFVAFILFTWLFALTVRYFICRYYLYYIYSTTFICSLLLQLIISLGQVSYSVWLIYIPRVWLLVFKILISCSPNTCTVSTFLPMFDAFPLFTYLITCTYCCVLHFLLVPPYLLYFTYLFTVNTTYQSG